MSTSPPPATPSSSAVSVGGNDDLLTEILTILPAKPLLRFKSVNKQWHSVISHPSFSLLHSLRHPHPPPSALFLLHHHHDPHSLSSPAFDFVPLSPPRRRPPSLSSPSDIVQSCNGLLLSLPKSTHSLSPILVSNPTTRQTARIPVRAGSDQGQVSGVNLAFDPARWAHYHVLVVSCVSNEDGRDCFSLDVYSSAARTWSVAAVYFIDAPFDTEFERGVYWRGRVLWLSHTASMVYYDFETGRIGRLGLPKVFDEGSYLERFRYFGESCGHLHLIEIRTNCVREFDVLELEEKEGGDLDWFVKYKVDLDVVGCGFEDDMFQDATDRFGRRLRFYAFSILALVRGNGDEDDDDDDDDGAVPALVLSIPGKVISYNFNSKVSRLICNVVDESVKWLPFQPCNAFQFIESLYCV